MGVSDLHVHSSSSCDCKWSLLDMCEHAASLGLEAIAFTEHVEFGPNDYCYGKFDYDAAFRLWQQAKQKYRGKLEILFGAEVTYWSNLEKEIRSFLKTHPFDIVMGSVHDAPPIDFWNPQNAGMIRDNPEMARKALRGYFSENEKMASSGLFDIVGHFGVYERHIPDAWPNVFEDEHGDLKDCLVSALKSIVENSRLELNAAVLHNEGYFSSPRVEVLRLYKQMGGCAPSFGSDAHSPKAVRRSFDHAEGILKEAGFESFASWEDVVGCRRAL